MGKRKLGHQTNPIPVDLESPTPDAPNDLLKHRTCWLHVLAYLRAHKKKVPRQQLLRLELTSPCLLGTYPIIRRKRSERLVKCKNAISKQKGKLNSGEFECYLENLWRSFSEDKKTCFTCLNSLWFHLYMKRSTKAKVLTWIKREQIFTKKYVLVPIVCWSHWSLLIFCHFGESLQSNTNKPCMLLLDSLQLADPRRLEADIRKFVLDIYIAEDRPVTRQLISQIPLLVPEVPQQTNGEECGNFVLYFINLFVKGAPDHFSIESYPYFMNKNWFSREGLESFCEMLKSNSLEK